MDMKTLRTGQEQFVSTANDWTKVVVVVVVVDFYIISQGQTGNGAQFHGSEFSSAHVQRLYKRNYWQNEQRVQFASLSLD